MFANEVGSIYGRSPEGKASEKKRSEKKSGGHDGDQNETVELADKPRSDGKSKKDKVKRVQSEDADMGPASPNYIVPSPPPASYPPRLPALLRMLPVTSSLVSAPQPYSPRENVDEASSAFQATTATSTASSTSTTVIPPTETNQSHFAPVTSSVPVSPRPTTLGSARHSMKMENLDRFMEKNLKKFVRDMGGSGSSLMLRVVKKLPADYELNASKQDALRAHAGDAIDL